MPTTPWGLEIPDADTPYPEPAWWSALSDSAEAVLANLVKFGRGVQQSSFALVGTFTDATTLTFNPPAEWVTYTALIHADIVIDGATSGDVIEMRINAAGVAGLVTADNQLAANRSLAAVTIAADVAGAMDYFVQARNTTASNGQVTTIVYTLTAHRRS